MRRMEVIVPCYKYGHYLRQCVVSILSQPGVDVRVMILDDASPDNTPEVAARLIKEDSRVQYRRHSQNKGHIATYNEGIEWLSGDYMLLLSADDMLTTGALARAVSVMEANPNVGATFGKAYWTSNPDQIVHRDPERLTYEVIDGTAFIVSTFHDGKHGLQTATAILRTALQQQIGGYRENLPHAGDMEMWLRCAAHADIGIINSHQAYYRKHQSNMSTSYYADRGDVEQRKLVFESFLAQYGDQLPSSSRLHRAAMAALARDALEYAYVAFESGNVSRCRDFMHFAVELDPGAWRSAAWGRMKLKTMLGPQMTRLIRTAKSGMQPSPQ